MNPECLHSLSTLIQNLVNLRVLMEILLTHTLYKSGTKNVRRETSIYLYHQLIKSGKKDVWGTVPSGDCFELSTGISSSVLRHCASTALVMTHMVLYVIQRHGIDTNIVAPSIWCWKLPPTIMIHWFLEEFSKDEKNAEGIYKLF